MSWEQEANDKLILSKENHKEKKQYASISVCDEKLLPPIEALHSKAKYCKDYVAILVFLGLVFASKTTKPEPAIVLRSLQSESLWQHPDAVTPLECYNYRKFLR